MRETLKGDFCLGKMPLVAGVENREKKGEEKHGGREGRCVLAIFMRSRVAGADEGAKKDVHHISVSLEMGKLAWESIDCVISNVIFTHIFMQAMVFR